MRVSRTETYELGMLGLLNMRLSWEELVFLAECIYREEFPFRLVHAA